MSNIKSLTDRKKMLEDSILGEVSDVSEIPMPSEELERVLLDGVEDPSVDPLVQKTNDADAENGDISEEEELDYNERSLHESDSELSIISDARLMDSQEHVGSANQEILEDDNTGENPVMEAANVVDGTAELGNFESLDIIEQMKQLPAILQELRYISGQLKAGNCSSASIGESSNFITKKDLEIFATKQDLDSLVTKADFVARLPSADKWTEMVDKLAPLASLDGLSVMMGSVMQQLRVIALSQRRLSRCQGKNLLLGKQLLADGKVDRAKFLKTSRKITNVYNSLRSYIARKVTSMEKESEMKELAIQLDTIRKEQEAFARVLEPGDHDEEPQKAALDEIAAIETTSDLAQKSQERQNEEVEKQKQLDTRRANSSRCFFCHENHDSFRCQKYPDLPSKMQLFREKNRCIICGQPGCDGSVATCKAKNRVCKNCDPSLPLEQREHHHTLCPRRSQKKRSLGGEKAKDEKVAPSEVLETEEKFGYNVDRFLDPSAQQRKDRYVVLAKHVIPTSDSEEEPTSLKRQAVSTDSARIADEPSLKKLKETKPQKKKVQKKIQKKKSAGGKNTKKAKKPVKESETAPADSVNQEQEAAHIENPSGSSN